MDVFQSYKIVRETYKIPSLTSYMNWNMFPPILLINIFSIYLYMYFILHRRKKTKQSLLQQVCALPFLYIHCGFAVFRTVHCQKQKKTHVAIVRNLALRSWSNRWVDHHNDITETQDGDEWLKYNDHLVSSSFDDYCQI